MRLRPVARGTSASDAFPDLLNLFQGVTDILAGDAVLVRIGPTIPTTPEPNGFLARRNGFAGRAGGADDGELGQRQ